MKELTKAALDNLDSFLKTLKNISFHEDSTLINEASEYDSANWQLIGTQRQFAKKEIYVTSENYRKYCFKAKLMKTWAYFPNGQDFIEGGVAIANEYVYISSEDDLENHISFIAKQINDEERDLIISELKKYGAFELHDIGKNSPGKCRDVGFTISDTETILNLAYGRVRQEIIDRVAFESVQNDEDIFLSVLPKDLQNTIGMMLYDKEELSPSERGNANKVIAPESVKTWVERITEAANKFNEAIYSYIE